MQIKRILIALAASFFVACAPNSHQHSSAEAETEEAHHHGAGEKYTVYSNRYELFMEATTGESDGQMELLLHLTRLSDFKPVGQAEISVLMETNGNIVSTKQAEAVIDGIYDCDLEHGAMEHARLLVLVNADGNRDTLIVPELHLPEAHDENESADEAHEEEAAGVNGITFTKEQQWKIDFATALPDTGAFGKVVKTTGKVEAVPADEVLLSAKTNGFVSFSSLVAEGAEFSKNQLVMIITGNELAENNMAVRYEKAKSEYELAKANYDRLKALVAEKVVAEKEVLEAKSNYQTARVAYESLEKQFSASGQKVVSTEAGYLKRLMVKNGQYVEAGDPLCSVFNNQKVQITADVSPKDLSDLQQIADVTIEIPGDKIFSLSSRNGKVLAIAKATNETNYLVPLTLQMNQTEGLIPGSFVQLFLRTFSSDQALTVPNTALLEEQGNFYLFVQVNPELFEKHEVKTGVSDGLRTEILSGLKAGDRVVTKGAVLVKLAKSSGALDAHSGHVH